MQANSPRQSKASRDAARFLDALTHKLPPDEERLILNGFVGDPQNPPLGAFRNVPWRPGQRIPFSTDANVYVTAASFSQAQDGRWRRRVECFQAAHAFMIDDIGTKVPLQVVERLRPSAIVETSQGNTQWWYLFTEPERDAEKFGGLIQAFITTRLGGHDPGMGSVTRVGRLPGYVNGKPQHGGWRCKLVELNDRRFTVDQLLRAFRLTIKPPRPVTPVSNVEAERKRAAYDVVERTMRRQGLIKPHARTNGGWTDCTCPWTANHTGGADSGAAIREPARENGATGAFKCHHGGCSNKGWAALTDWIAEQAAARLAERNKAAPTTLKEALRQ